VLSLIDDAKVAIFRVTSIISDRIIAENRHLLDANQDAVCGHNDIFTHYNHNIPTQKGTSGSGMRISRLSERFLSKNLAVCRKNTIFANPYFN